jgi:hypothetical protein
MVHIFIVKGHYMELMEFKCGILFINDIFTEKMELSYTSITKDMLHINKVFVDTSFHNE